LIEQLVKDKQIEGKISKGIYTPTSFSTLQETTIQSTYRANGYLELTVLQKLQVPQHPSEYLSKLCPDIVLLKTIGIPQATYSMIES